MSLRATFCDYITRFINTRAIQQTIFLTVTVGCAVTIRRTVTIGRMPPMTTMTVWRVSEMATVMRTIT